jgi:uncharacterized protein YbaA (DUF1428 family)
VPDDLDKRSLNISAASNVPCRFRASWIDVVMSARQRDAGAAYFPYRSSAMSYVDGYVLPVPKKNLAKYRALARKAGRIWMEYGALQYVETVEDDVKPGKVTSFPQSVKLKKGEVVIFSWIVFKTRKQRDSINKKVMADPRLANMNINTMPFDGKRMFWGGFKPIVQF